MRKRVVLYTDGSSRGNPGPGGYGAILQYQSTSGACYTKEVSEGFEETTNNRMELLAAIAGLRLLKEPCEVDLHSDSQYLVDAFNKHWIENWKRNGWKTSTKKPVKNKDLWEELAFLTDTHEVRFHWVKGHDGNDLNERCDQLATSAADGPGKSIDKGFSPE